MRGCRIMPQLSSCNLICWLHKRFASTLGGIRKMLAVGHNVNLKHTPCTVVAMPQAGRLYECITLLVTPPHVMGAPREGGQFSFTGV